MTDKMKFKFDLKESLLYRMTKRGRPSGTTKDQSRTRVLNPNGRYIDYGGPQYNKLINEGYTVNCYNQLLKNPNATIIKRSRGRPKVIYPVATRLTTTNPKTGRMIKTTSNTFKRLTKKYKFDINNNVFIAHVKHPKNESNHILINGDNFKNYINKGYIYDQGENKLIKPSKKTETAFGKALVTRDLTILNKNDPEDQMNKLNQRISFLLSNHLKKLKGLRFNIGMAILFTKPDPVNKNQISETFYIIGKSAIITHESDISQAIQMQRNKISIGIDRYTNAGSGWVIDEITRHYLSVGEYKPLAARSYIPLPPHIQNRKATINIKNDDDKCFMYCLGRVLDSNPEKNNLERVSKHLKKVCTDLGLDKIKMPVTVTDIPNIEKKFNISINLYSFDDDNGIYPIKLSRKENVKHMNLL